MIDQDLIRVTNFKIDHLRDDLKEEKLPTEDCFIHCYGHVYYLDKWHHVEKATEIIQAMDSNIQYEIDSKKRGIKQFTRLLNEGPKDEFEVDWVNSMRRFHPDDYENHLKERIEQLKEKLSTYKIHHMNDLKAAMLNKGYDAAEFLIINYGFVALSEGRVHYREVSSSQLRALGCYAETDEDGRKVIKPYDKSILDFAENKLPSVNSIISIMNDKEYYSNSVNAFHCPSGIPRMGWDRRYRNAMGRIRSFCSDSNVERYRKEGLIIPLSKSGELICTNDVRRLFVNESDYKLYLQAKNI